MNPDTGRRQSFARWINVNTIGLVLLFATIGLSLGRVLRVHRELFEPGKTVIRIGHAALELGFREALDDVIAEYERLHPDVKVLQIGVPQKIYGEWLNTQLISDTAPDLVELYLASMVLDEHYLGSLFESLADNVDRPNPYNADTPLAEWPWRATFLGGMRSGFREGLQDYYGAPITLGTIRVYYNKQLLREATGSDAPLKTFDQFLRACEAIHHLSERTGGKVTPIAGNLYIVGTFLRRYRVAFTAGYEPELDLDLDGLISLRESYIGYLQGSVDMQEPNIRAYFECMKELSRHFGEGYLGLWRDQAAFLFVQGRAAMLAAGSWDATSLFAQSNFEIGVFDFPLPVEGERWGQYIAGRENEARHAGGTVIGLYKGSKNKRQALDFLQFLTSRKYNEMLTRKAGWIPVIVGAQPSDRMKPFLPDPTGSPTGVDVRNSGYVYEVIHGEEWPFLHGEIDYEEFAGRVDRALRDPGYGGDRQWSQEYDQMWRWCRNQERVLAAQASGILMDSEAPGGQKRYNRLLLQQALANNGESIRYQFEQVRGKPIPEM
jgi:raffinose/stachyose/melibiose transport system substrate-binding protein